MRRGGFQIRWFRSSSYLPGLLGAASKIAQRDGRLVEMYLFAALVYFVISFVASLLNTPLSGSPLPPQAWLL